MDKGRQNCKAGHLDAPGGNQNNEHTSQPTMMSSTMLKELMTGLLLALATLSGAQAEEQAPAHPDGYAYYALNPELITNYITDGLTMGYVRVKVEIMVDGSADLALVEKHDPLIRDTLNQILGSQTGERIRSLSGREEIRKECQAKLNRLLVQETGRKLVRELLFTNYLYQ